MHISNQASSFSYFTDGLKTIEHFGAYVQELTIKLNHIRTEQDDEKRSLIEIRNSLKNSPGFNKMVRLILDSRRCMMTAEISLRRTPTNVEDEIDENDDDDDAGWGKVQEPQRYLTGCTHRLSNPIAFALPDTDIY